MIETPERGIEPHWQRLRMLSWPGTGALLARAELIILALLAVTAGALYFEDTPSSEISGSTPATPGLPRAISTPTKQRTEPPSLRRTRAGH